MDHSKFLNLLCFFELWSTGRERLARSAQLLTQATVTKIKGNRNLLVAWVKQLDTEKERWSRQQIHLWTFGRLHLFLCVNRQLQTHSALRGTLGPNKETEKERAKCMSLWLTIPFLSNFLYSRIHFQPCENYRENKERKDCWPVQTHILLVPQ